ncbi:MAG: hypothetical protein AAGA93_11365 [Actinomycetota bacterium]
MGPTTVVIATLVVVVGMLVAFLVAIQAVRHEERRRSDGGRSRITRSPTDVERSAPGPGSSSTPTAS